MFKVRAKIDGVMKALDRMGRIPKSAIYRRLKPQLRQELRDHGKRQQSPEGRWRALAATTLARRARAKRRRNKKLLGRLPNLWQIEANAESLKATNLVKWSRIQDEGGRGAKHANIPARKFAYVGSRFLWIVSKAFLRACIGLFTGGRRS